MLEMISPQGTPFQLELTIIHPGAAHGHCQDQALSALQGLRPHLWAMGYGVDHIHQVDGVGTELFDTL